jgi:hypothetical protein
VIRKKVNEGKNSCQEKIVVIVRKKIVDQGKNNVNRKKILSGLLMSGKNTIVVAGKTITGGRLYQSPAMMKNILLLLFLFCQHPQQCLVLVPLGPSLRRRLLEQPIF